MNLLHQQIVAYSPFIVGAAGIPLIQQFVQFVKIQLKVPVYLAPLVALLSGIILNVAVAAYLGQPVPDAITIGLAAGLGASGWHELSH